ncbi:hypothetical protein E0Z10_g3935 [Xylaria hypoxylon]|uniref:Heterokaryon incompatibility domain-containing protein n=1 Tax=Xylaria hypoxylon TaxID=37992 RepID=A0A4Z0YKP4_9PEZI|nr:hypothetical protein E0Z10_g3935 [Xylaria hypoxylon]
MGKISLTAALLAGGVLLSRLVSADRTCSSNVSSSYLWRVSDARFDGADPSTSDGKAVVAVSVVPNTTSTFFECVAEWPESWAGWSPVDGNIIWSDCIWSGAGPTLDTAVAFALDWKKRTMYLSHTFSCSDKKGSDSMATGSFSLDLDCKTASDESAHCTLKSKTTSPGLQVKTVPGAPRLAANATCDDNAKVYQSWQLENWRRQYRLTPGVPVSPPPMDSGPSFTLRNIANGGVFECVPGNKTQDNIFDGACTQAAGSSTVANAKASFQFDPVLDMLVITESWECGAESSFNASGVAFIQATCQYITSMEWFPFTRNLQEFEYPGLPPDSRTFRIIKLLSPVKSLLLPFKETLSIEIIEASVDDATGKYDTLSYCWGSGAADRTVVVSLSNNGKSSGEYRTIRISASLESALLSLAREGNIKDSRPIFTDQISINQADNFEKVQQVRLMGEIYGGSARAIVWLGDETTETRRCFEFSSELNGEGVLGRVMGPNVSHSMKVFGAVMDSDIELETEAQQEDRDDILDLIARYGPRFPRRGLTEVLRRAWFNRLWTVQEGCLPPIVIFRCGEKSMPKEPVSTEEIRGRNEIYNLNKPILRLVKERKTIHNTQESRKPLYDTVVRYNVNDDGLKIGATKAEDRIYALLGLAASDEITRETVEGMEVDNVRGSYTKFASSVIKRNADVLLFSQVPKSPAYGHQLPSWVPDWSADSLRTPHGYLDLTTSFFSAGGSEPNHDIDADVSTGILRIKAIPVGRVMRVGVYGIRPDENATLDNIEYTSLRRFFDELGVFMELATKINPAHAPDISDDQRRLESMTRLSDGGLSARQFPAQFSPTTATAMLQRFHQQASNWGKKLTDVEAQYQSLARFTGMIRSAGIMPWYWTPASEIDVIRLCAVDPISAARLWMKGLSLVIYDVGFVLWYIAKLRYHKTMITVRRIQAKHKIERTHQDKLLEQVGLTNDVLLSKEWDLFTSNLFRNIGRKLFLTETGYVGLGPGQMQVGDTIAVIPGSTVPHVLRPQASRLEFPDHHDSDQNVPLWSYVGEAYCDGIMDGQLIAAEGKATQMFEIV